DSKDGKLPDTPYFEKAGPLLKAMVGKPLTLLITPTGKAREVKRPEGLAEELKKINDESAAMGLHPDAQSALLAQGGLLLPNYNAGKGKAWEVTVIAKVPGGKFTTRNTYEHGGTETRGGKKLEVIRITPKTTFEGDGSDKLKLKGSESSGKAYFDRAAGRLVEQTITTTTEIQFMLYGSPTVQKIEVTRTMKLAE